MKTERGFALPEVLIAMVVLAVALTVTAPMLGFSIRTSSDARKLTAAQLLGTQILEQLRLEIRYDPAPAGGSIMGGPGFTLADAWKADRLPYSTLDSLTGSVGALTDCQPDGAEDPVTYSIGPFRSRFEGHEFYVCYDLTTSTRTDVPANSVEATVKVMWPSIEGFSARWITGVLMNGR